MRGFFLTVLAGGLIFGAIAWSTGLIGPPADGEPGDNLTSPGAKSDEPKEELGPRLFPGEPVKEPKLPDAETADPIVIPECHLNVLTEYKQEVPSRIDGKMLFIGYVDEKD